MPTIIIEVGTAVCLFAVLWIANLAGGWFARRVKVRKEDMQQLGVVQTAMLGLLALLLGFSYAGAMGRFVARQDLLVSEANAVGTAWLRTDLVQSGTARQELRDSIRRYIDARIDLFEHAGSGDADTLAARLISLHSDLWAKGVAAVQGQHDLGLLVLPPLNDVADLISAQSAARTRHLPTLIMGVILVCAFGSVASVGFSSVFIERRTHLPAVVLVVLIAAALWLIIDLDYPRLGLIRIDHQTLTDLRASMDPATR